jgi:fumarate reductase flavoprotein subunit
VILAAGGFIGNRDMKLQYYGADVREEAVHTDRGDGIAMGLAAGAGPYNIDMPGTVHIAQVKNIIQEKLFADSAKDTLYKTVLTNLLLKGDSLVVALNQGQAGDLRGKRFTNEAGMFQPGIAFDSWKAGGFFAAIYSKNVLDDIKANGYKFTGMTMFLGQGNPPAAGTPIADLDDILAKGAAKGNVVTAATLGELETLLEVPAGTLKATIDQYNTYVDGAADANPEYDKSNFGAFGPPSTYNTAPKVDSTTGPYTAILGAGYFYGSGGGLDIDDEMQVLDNTGSHVKIPGLYAVGQDSMGVLFNAKKAYVGYGAAAQGWAITSGRIAGENASVWALAH